MHQITASFLILGCTHNSRKFSVYLWPLTKLITCTYVVTHTARAEHRHTRGRDIMGAGMQFIYNNAGNWKILYLHGSATPHMPFCASKRVTESPLWLVLGILAALWPCSPQSSITLGVLNWHFSFTTWHQYHKAQENAAENGAGSSVTVPHPQIKACWHWSLGPQGMSLGEAVVITVLGFCSNLYLEQEVLQWKEPKSYSRISNFWPWSSTAWGHGQSPK